MSWLLKGTANHDIGNYGVGVGNITSADSGSINSPNNEESEVLSIFVVTLCSSVLGSICSLLLILLIRELATKIKYTGHLMLINTMSYFQLLYCISFFTSVVIFEDNLALKTVSLVFQSFGGMGSSVFTNFMAIITFISVKQKIFVDVSSYYLIFLLLALLPGVVSCILYLIPDMKNEVHNFYLYFRLASIGLNFFLCASIFIIVRRMKSAYFQAPTEAEKALNLMAFRLFYYPLVQALSRIAISAYETSKLEQLKLKLFACLFMYAVTV